MRESKGEVSIYRYGKEGISIIPAMQGNASQSQWVLFLEFSRLVWQHFPVQHRHLSGHLLRLAAVLATHGM